MAKDTTQLAYWSDGAPSIDIEDNTASSKDTTQMAYWSDGAPSMLISEGGGGTVTGIMTPQKGYW